jgi:tetratricopeptide (TPR) repeat protein
MMRFLFLITCILCIHSQINAQTVNDLLKTSNRLEAEGHLYDAAVLQEKAWRIKPQDKNLAWQAGHNYYYAKDYRKAVDCLQAVKMEAKSWPMAGLMYARALKSDNRYRESMEAYTQFLKTYVGADKKTLEGIVVLEMRGCDYALQLIEAKKTKKNTDLRFEILPEGVNSVENEFAPIPVTDDLLYFSSNWQGSAKIYRIIRQEGKWSRPELAQGLPTPVEQHFGNGCFSPDGSRFYFTQCAGVKNQKEGRAICSIYMTRRNGNQQWSEPQRLRDYINLEGSTNTQPYVFELNGEEVIIFSSDRAGGMGGLDLYRCARPLTSDDMDFSLPVSLGALVNTIGDELSPFVDTEAGLLYFSSNSHLSIGGFDIYQVPYNESGAEVSNIGMPYNSAADDFGFILKKTGAGGFLVSNRQELPQKVSTRHDDIFEFSNVQKSHTLVATAFDATHHISLRDVDVTLYEKDADGRLRLLTMATFPDGEIHFPIQSGAHYMIEASKDGYLMASAETSRLTEINTGGHKLSVNLLKKEAPAPKQSASRKKDSVSNPKPKPAPAPTAATGTNPVGFFIQLEAVQQYETDTDRYDAVRSLGEVRPIGSTNSEEIRVLLGPFSTKDEANQMARNVREQTAFIGAFVVRI